MERYNFNCEVSVEAKNAHDALSVFKTAMEDEGFEVSQPAASNVPYLVRVPQK